MKLSIVFVTMNRAEQLKKAIESCLDSDIPKDTQFVIIDNGSKDQTETVVRTIGKANTDYSFDYYKMKENLGISEGRNEGKRHALGEYSFYMDDDAVIAEECKQHFFTTSIKLLDSDSKIGSLTTKVYDETLKVWRESRKSKNYSRSKPEVQVFHGNTYFIRNDIDGMFYLPTIKYAYEDLYLSILIKDRGYYNALNEDVYIIHQPLVNKWIPGSDSLFEIYVKANAAQLTIKSLLYPRRYLFWVFLGYIVRCYKTSHFKGKMLSKSFSLYKEQVKGNRISRISNETMKNLISLFGFKETM